MKTLGSLPAAVTAVVIGVSGAAHAQLSLCFDPNPNVRTYHAWIDFYWAPPESLSGSLIWSTSCVSLSVAGFHGCEHGGISCFDGWAYCDNFQGDSTASVTVSGCVSSACTAASVLSPTPQFGPHEMNIIHEHAWSGPAPDCWGWDVYGGWAMITGYYRFTPQSLRTTTVQRQFRVEFPRGIDFDGVTNRVTVLAVMLEDVGAPPSVFFVRMAGARLASGPGLSYDEQADMWYADATNSVATGDHQVAVRKIAYADARMDANDDGRFNALDVPAVAARIGSTNPADVYRWDFDSSGQIDSPDVAFLNELMDAGMHSGIFGDFDQDGDVDCADLTAAESHFGSCLGDAQYSVELDYDLDGCSDSSDRAALYHLVLPGDIDMSGVVGEGDLGLLLAAIGSVRGDFNYNPIADLDDDGDVDESDLGMLLSNWGHSC